MRAAWYERQGPPAAVLRVGSLPDPEPGPGEVRVRLTMSGVNPGDAKKRQGWLGSRMPYPRVIPHSDGAGIVDAVGDEVDPRRRGERVAVYGAQSYRAFGTAAQLCCVPSRLAVAIPDGVTDVIASSLGIPGITAHRAVYADGPVAGQVVLVHGVLGGVGSYAAQLAAVGGARVIGTVRTAADLDTVRETAAVDRAVDLAVALDDDSIVEQIRALAPDGVGRVIEVSLSDNADLDAGVIGQGAVIAAYSTRAERPELPFWPLLFSNVTIRLLGSDDFPADAKDEAMRDLIDAAEAARLAPAVGTIAPLDQIAEAHAAVESGRVGGRVFVSIPSDA